MSQNRDRSTYIGGRDVAVLAGMSPYGSAFDTYAKIVHGHTIESNPAMERGLMVEPGVLDWVERRRKVKLQRDVFVVDDLKPFMAGSCDAVELGDDGRPRYVHEVKSTRARGAALWGTPGTDEVEPSCWAQVQWYTGLTGAQGAFVWLWNLDVDDGVQEYYVRADPAAYLRLRALAEDFWVNHIVVGVPPAPTGKTDAAAVAAVWPTPTPGKEVEADVAIISLAGAYDLARKEAKLAEEAKDRLAGELKARIADGEFSQWEGGKVSWSASSLAAKTDYEAVAYELAQIGNVPGEAFNAVVAKHTGQRRTARTLRVSIKGAK